jgi:hypothetical protein
MDKELLLKRMVLSKSLNQENIQLILLSVILLILVQLLFNQVLQEMLKFQETLKKYMQGVVLHQSIHSK